VVCLIASVQLVTTGVVTELVARTWFSSPGVHSYVVREEDAERPAGGDEHPPSDEAWHEGDRTVESRAT
jgi:hypothetical protein